MRETLGEGDILFLNPGVRYSGTYNTVSENPSSCLHLSPYGKVCHTSIKGERKVTMKLLMQNGEESNKKCRNPLLFLGVSWTFLKRICLRNSILRNDL